MPRFSLAIVLCVGALALMLLPLVVPVTFSKGIAGRGSLLPSWLNVTIFYAIGAAVVALTGREVARDLRRRRRKAASVRHATVTVRLDQQTELATFPANTRGTIHVRLLDVQTSVRAQFVGRVCLRGDPPHTLGDLVHDDGAPRTEFEADLPRTHTGVLEWDTTHLETQTPTNDAILARIEVRLLVSSTPTRMQ